jgi:anti-anti-sigma regulatory factor
MESTFKKSKNKGIITFHGDMTVQHAAGIKDVLIKALKETEHVLLEFGQVGIVDLSALQLMCSAHRTATAQKKTLAYASEPPDAYRNAMEAAGYLRTKGCYLDSTESCIWVSKKF